MRLYGTPLPPLYPLENISTPILLFYSKGDYLATESDAETLVKWLPNVRALEKISLDEFNHVDFLWGLDSYKVLYKKLISYMEQYRY